MRYFIVVDDFNLLTMTDQTKNKKIYLQKRKAYREEEEQQQQKHAHVTRFNCQLDKLLKHRQKHTNSPIILDESHTPHRKCHSP